jgi:hypothetical protein
VIEGEAADSEVFYPFICNFVRRPSGGGGMAKVREAAGESDACCEGSEQITFLLVLDILTARSTQGNQAWEGGETI